MLAQPAKHEAVSASPAAAILGGAGGKGKKAAGLAGLFSDILSQAQKSLGKKAADGAKVSEAAKAASLLKGGVRPGAIPSQATHMAAPSGPKTADTVKSLKPQPSAAPVAAARVLDASGTRSADEAQARKSREKRLTGGAGDAGDAEAKLKKTIDDKRRAKPANDTKADDAAAVRAALAASKSVPAIAVAPKAKASQSEADQSIGAGKKSDRAASTEPKLTVLDLRRSVESRRDASAKVDASAKADDGSKEAIRDSKAGGHGSGQEIVRDFSLGAKASGDATSSWKADSSLAAGRSQDFQSLLAERMRDAWNGEIVKNAHIVLKDGDSGTIRLRLKPESLGNVKIELNLSDNNISGRIIVESDEAKNAFERNMNELADAFKQGGFDSARLEVAVGGGSGGGASGNGEHAGDSAGPFYSERLRSAVGSSADPATAASAYARRGGAVDILA
jgi:flagellar hook-length control protein FliK